MAGHGHGAQPVGRRGQGAARSRRIKCTDVPMELAIIADSLPPPEELRLRLRKVKVMLEVGAATVAAFRKKAGGKGHAYRRMMGELLDVYATRQLVGKGR